jgi:hypothetical protein
MLQGLIENTSQNLFLNLIDNELKFEVEVVFKSRQLQGHEQDCFVKWKD